MMRKSIYIKLVGVFILVFVLGNAFSFAFTALTGERDMREALQSKLSSFVSDVKHVYENGNITQAELERLNQEGFIRIAFYEDAGELAYHYGLSTEALTNISDTPMALQGRRHGDVPILSAVRSGNQIIVASPSAQGVMRDLRRYISNAGMLSVLIGSAVMIIAAWFTVRPIKKLSKATERIAKGDFTVQIQDKRKDELGKLIDSFNAMARELDGMEMMRSGFISDISHEFRTPLTSIEGYAKLLRHCNSDEEREEYISIITEETQRLSNLSGSILLLNKIENENIALSKAAFRLDEQIRKMLVTCEREWSGKNIDLHIQMDTVNYVGNEQLLYQVWLNLFNNAVKFSSPGGIIEIGLKQTDDEVIFQITDYGKGMSEQEKKRMFEKFYVGDPSRSAQGNGLGLSIVKRIVDMHGGRIAVKSTPDEYTSIAIYLHTQSDASADTAKNAAWRLAK